MGHCIVEEAEEILDIKFPVLDNGFVRLVDYLGSDDRIVQAARVSYGEGTKTLREDAGLIDYLLRNEHTSPFEQVIFTFHAKMPIFVARQWVRHRTARLNEISGRYSVMPDEFYVPDLQDIAEQSPDNKQGRSKDAMDEDKAIKLQSIISSTQINAYNQYTSLLEAGTARELARIILPLNAYTEWYWQIDLHNLFRFIRLRIDPHAQKEIRAYASVIQDLASKVCPLAFKSFSRHILGGIRFTARELKALKCLLEGAGHGLEGRAAERFEMKIKEARQI